MSTIDQQKKILIIGAGIAGLAACKQLMANGISVEILEARNRYGGRIATDTSLGIPIGLGATWIHGHEGNPITALAEQSHTKLIAAHMEQFIIMDRHGQAIPTADIDNFYTKFDELLIQAKAIAFQADHDIPLSEALADLIKPENLSPVEQDIFKNRLSYFQGYIGADYHMLSARHWDQEKPWPGQNYLLTDSYQPIIDMLAADCPITLNAIVNTIRQTATGVEVITGEQTYHADAVIITVPLGVLKKGDITFDPPLPQPKLQAIQQLGMGLLNLTIIKFAESFFPADAEAIIFTQFDATSIPVFFNHHYFTGHPILVGYSGGSRAEQIEQFSDEETLEKTLTNLKKVFGNDIPKPIAYINTRWSQDPYSYGSYSYLPTGSTGKELEEIARPVANKLFFAGEATSTDYLATTHGAYLSGLRAATEVRAALCKQNS